ncbi:MAG: hypothetical protein P4L59_17530 [Desulfosporosinus sp.]|nr:hypothetical protein [Desulfosporosinus sp.]
MNDNNIVYRETKQEFDNFRRITLMIAIECELDGIKMAAVYNG